MPADPQPACLRTILHCSRCNDQPRTTVSVPNGYVPVTAEVESIPEVAVGRPTYPPTNSFKVEGLDEEFQVNDGRFEIRIPFAVNVPPRSRCPNAWRDSSSRRWARGRRATAACCSPLAAKRSWPMVQAPRCG